MKRIVEKVKTHRKIVHAHLKKHHKKYLFGFLSAALLIKIIPALIAGIATWHFNFSFADETQSTATWPMEYTHGDFKYIVEGVLLNAYEDPGEEDDEEETIMKITKYIDSEPTKTIPLSAEYFSINPEYEEGNLCNFNTTFVGLNLNLTKEDLESLLEDEINDENDYFIDIVVKYKLVEYPTNFQYFKNINGKRLMTSSSFAAIFGTTTTDTTSVDINGDIYQVINFATITKNGEDVELAYETILSDESDALGNYLNYLMMSEENYDLTDENIDTSKVRYLMFHSLDNIDYIDSLECIVESNNEGNDDTGGDEGTSETGYTVTYTDGVDDEEVFADQITTGLSLGDDIPGFDGTPTRTGYTFSGWSPEVTGKVEGNQTYIATWYINENGGNNNSGDDNGGNGSGANEGETTGSGANEGETTGSGANDTEGVCSSNDLLVTYPISGDYLKLEDVRLTWHLSGSDCSGEIFTIKIYGGTNTGYVTLGTVSANSGEFDDLSGFNVSGLLGSKYAIFLGDSDPLKDSPDFYIDEEKPTVTSSYKFTPERTTTFGLNDKVDIIFTGSEELTGITVNVLGRNASFVSKTGLRYKYSIQLSTGNNTGGFIYNISFRDVAGNTGYYEYYNSGLTTDTTLPEISGLQFTRVSEKTGQVSFSLTKTGNVTFKYVLSGGKATETLSDTNTSSFSTNLSKARTDKASYVYKYVITVEDLVGNKNYYAGTFQLSGNTFGYTLVTSTGSNIKTGTAVSMITILSDELSAFSGCKAKTGMNYSLIQYNVTVNKNQNIVKVQMPKFNDSTIQSSAETVSRLLVNALQGSTISGLNQSKLNVFAGELNDYFVLVKMKRDPEICDANLSILPSLYMTRLLNTLKAYKIIN